MFVLNFKCISDYDVNLGVTGTMVPYQNCSENRGGCDHTCHQMEYGVICSCKKGFELADDGHTCTGKHFAYATVFSLCI